MWRRLPKLIVFLALAQAPIPAQNGPSADENLSKRVDDIFQKMDTTVSPGCALSVMRDGRIIYERGYGMADLDHDIPITTGTVFHVASISKQFTATAILLLAQEGKLSLDSSGTRPSWCAMHPRCTGLTSAHRERPSGRG